MLTEDTALDHMNAAAASLPPYPAGRFESRGIVIPGGGVKYFPSAWVCINMLRHVGCTLPIELWHLGPDEMSDEMKSLVEPLGVTCVDALEVRKQFPVRTVGKANGGHEGWELKPYCILHSRFREILFFDADNMPVVDPTFLFDTPQYRERGAIFWPDPFFYTADDPIWKLTGVPYRHEPQFESGQILVDKARCWNALCLTMWMNEHSDFWYRYIYGDKDTFHMAWRKRGVEYAMPEKTYERIQGVMCHHDFDGRRIFQHRHGHKWVVDGRNSRVKGSELANECENAIVSLRHKWPGRPTRPYIDNETTPRLRCIASQLCGQEWVCRRLGTDEHYLCFRLDGSIGPGSRDFAYSWNLADETDGVRLHLFGAAGAIKCLGQTQDGTWTTLNGSALSLIPTTTMPRTRFDWDLAGPAERHLASYFAEEDWLYGGLNQSARRLAFGRDGFITTGSSSREVRWNVQTGQGGQSLWLFGIQGTTAILHRVTEHRWEGDWITGGAGRLRLFKA